MSTFGFFQRKLLIVAVVGLALLLLFSPLTPVANVPSSAERLRALVMIHMHLCSTSNTSTVWGNIEWFLDNDGLIRGPTGLWAGVDYIFLYSGSRLPVQNTTEKECRITFESGNIRVVETPAAYGDLQAYGFVARDFGESERWVERYGRFILFNTGSRGPFELVDSLSGSPIEWEHGSGGTWVDVVSTPLRTINASTEGGLSLIRHAVVGADPEETVICPTVSFWPEMHCQSYFLSLPVAAARVLLFGIYQTAFRNKHQVIFDGEVAGCRVLHERKFFFYDLSRQVIAQPEHPLQEGVAYWVEGVLNTSRSVFAKHGGVSFFGLPERFRVEVQQLAEKRLKTWSGRGDVSNNWGSEASVKLRLSKEICGFHAQCNLPFPCTSTPAEG